MSKKYIFFFVSVSHLEWFLNVVVVLVSVAWPGLSLLRQFVIAN